MECRYCKAEVSSDSIYCHKCGSSLSGKESDTSLEFTRDFGDEMTFFFSPGDNFGPRYKIIEEIGRGGMGRVYKAKDRELNTVVALKMIRPEFLTNGRMIRRFKKEILLAREISHENVVRIYDFGEVKGIKFISMQYIEGKSLKELILESGPLPLEKIKDITIKICRGLLAAHKNGIVHRDLKPHNIMIDKNDNLYITDFGLAKTTGEASISQSGIVVGTPQYIAPEQWRGEEADNRTDIYTLGIILYEMITGKQLFVAEDEIGYLQKHVHEKPVFPGGPDVKIPNYFKYIIQKCLEKKRQHRYQSLKEIIIDIEAGAFTQGSIIYRMKRSSTLKKAAACLLILLVLYGIYRLGRIIMKVNAVSPAARQYSIAVLNFKNLTNDMSLDHWRDAIPYLLTTDLGQMDYFRALPEDRLNYFFKEKKAKKSKEYSQDIYTKIRSKEGVDFILSGSFAWSGGEMRILVEIEDLRNGSSTKYVYADAQMDNIFSAIDQLTLKIINKLNLPEPFADSDKEVGAITTSSQKALELFVDGKHKFYEENYEEAIILFEKAASLDQKFAMAYKWIAWSYAHMDDMKNRKKYLEKAFQHIENLPKKERLLIEGYYYAEDEKTLSRAEASLQELLKIDPTNYEAQTKMGMHLYLVGEWDRAVTYLKRVTEHPNPDHQPYTFLMLAYMTIGEYEKAREMVENYHKIFSTKNRLLRYTCDSYIIQEKFDLAEEVINEINEINIDDPVQQYNRGQLYFYKGNLKEAEREFRKDMEKLKKDKTSILYFEALRYLRLLYLLQGKFKKSIDLLRQEIDNSKNFDDKISAVFELIYLYIRLGKPDKALEEVEKNVNINLDILKERPYYYRRKLFYEILVYLELAQSKKVDASLKELKEYLYKSEFKRDIKYYYFIKGTAERKKGNLDQAISNFEKAISYLPHQKVGMFFKSDQAPFLYELAVTHFKAGNFEEANKEFEKITKLTLGRLYFGDLYAKSFYYLGKSYKKRKYKERAINNYQQFLELWKDSDPGSPEKEDAREQLKKLKIET